VSDKGTKYPDIDQEGSICTVEAIVSVDERGQMVLPKELRKRAGIKAGEKLAITSWQRDGDICCITLTKVDGLAEMLKVQLAPVMKEAL
jgi:antitoxin PrlF